MQRFEPDKAEYSCEVAIIAYATTRRAQAVTPLALRAPLALLKRAGLTIRLTI